MKESEDSKKPKGHPGWGDVEKDFPVPEGEPSHAEAFLRRALQARQQYEARNQGAALEKANQSHPDVDGGPAFQGTVVGKPPQWQGTQFEAIRKSLCIPGTSETDPAQIGLWNYCYGMADRIAKDAKKKEPSYQTLTQQAKEHKRIARLCQTLAPLIAKYDPGLGEHLRAKARVHAEHSQAAAEADRACKDQEFIDRWPGEPPQDSNRRKAALAEISRSGRRTTSATTRDIVHLLDYVKHTTSQAHYKEIKELLGAFGYRVSVGNLKEIASRYGIARPRVNRE